MPVDEVNELLGTALPVGDWDTVGGLLLHLLGHVPAEGESAESAGCLLVAERVQGRRIGAVGVVKAAVVGSDGTVPGEAERAPVGDPPRGEGAVSERPGTL